MQSINAKFLGIPSLYWLIQTYGNPNLKI